jgi:tetrahydromethanopterin S-methyltransferase F subunit
VRSIRPFLLAGALGGVCGGVVAATFQWLVTEVQIRAALELEHASAIEDHEELFGRTTQVAGGMLATTIYGIVIGVVFGVVLARVWHLLGARSTMARVASVAGCGYLAWSLVPLLKYPPNPPGVGDPDTVGARTIDYLTFLGASIVLVVLAAMLWRWTGGRRLDAPSRVAITIGGYGLLLAVCVVVWPSGASADGLPADLVWRFRVDSLVQTTLLWIVVALVVASVLERAGRATRSDDLAAHTG